MSYFFPVTWPDLRSAVPTYAEDRGVNVDECSRLSGTTLSPRAVVANSSNLSAGRAHRDSCRPPQSHAPHSQLTEGSQIGVVREFFEEQLVTGLCCRVKLMTHVDVHLRALSQLRIGPALRAATLHVRNHIKLLMTVSVF